jgi:hypothetical protein
MAEALFGCRRHGGARGDLVDHAEDLLHQQSLQGELPAAAVGEAAGARRHRADGSWGGNEIKLGAPLNHAKGGVSTSGDKHYVIFGDLNQQGALSRPDCGKSRNGRGGLFFVLDNKTLADSLGNLIDGDTAPTRGKP